MACKDDPPGYVRGWLGRRTRDEFFHFAYTDVYFNLLGSNLDQFPVSGAVAASAAFPVLIDHAELADHCREDKDVDQSSLVLMDGGANYNQGVMEIDLTLRELILGERRSYVPPEQQETLTKDDAAFIIVINSSISDTTGPTGSGNGSGPLGFIAYISATVQKISQAVNV